MNIPKYSKLFIQIVRETSCTGNTDESGHADVRESDCPGKVLYGKRVVWESSCPGKGLVRETSVWESDCPGNVRYPAGLLHLLSSVLR